jgi:hypothetical protein
MRPTQLIVGTVLLKLTHRNNMREMLKIQWIELCTGITGREFEKPRDNPI